MRSRLEKPEMGAELMAAAAAAVACAGLGQAVAGYVTLRRFRAPPVSVAARPGVTLLKPLHGDEAMLEDALASNLMQDYPDYQVVFGVQRPDDPALLVVQRLRARFPNRDIAVVCDATLHGRNRKIGNLLNMFPAARHDVIVIADSDVHVAPDYLARVVDALLVPGTGLVTTLYTGLSATRTLPGLMGASAITHGFLPGALLGRSLGRQDCLGATMALRRDTLLAVGGLEALSDHLADDNMLGRLVLARGLRVGLAATVPATTVCETTLPELFRHELRWARTIRSLVPWQFALSTVQYPLVWAALAMGLSNGENWSICLFLLAWAVRAFMALAVDDELASSLAPMDAHASISLATPAPIWLLPLRDLMSVSVILASTISDRVEWRGHTLRTDAKVAIERADAPSGAI
jgi:ceramide glucosyltransferase